MIPLHPAQEARKFLAPPSEISTCEWGMLNHMLTLATSANAGPWSTDLIPFLISYLDALDDPCVREVTLQKPTQEAGSETTLVWLKRVAREDPGPAMWVFADEDTAKRFCLKRILPAFRNCPELSPLIDPAHFGQGEIILKNGFSLVMVWASSIPKTATDPIKYLILDEITKPAYSMTQGQGDVILRIEERCEKFPDHKKVKLSSVAEEGDNMALQMARMDAVYDFHVPCPACGELQPLAFREWQGKPEVQLDRDDHPAHEKTGFVFFPKEGKPEDRAKEARYVCRSCKNHWTTAKKNEAVSKGLMIARPGAPENPKRKGFFISRLLSMTSGGRLEALAEKFLLAQGDLETLQSFVNNALAEHWKTYKITSTVEELMKAKCGLPAQVVPDKADCIIITFDMQQTGFWYLVRAWSSKIKESWMIECGQAADWEEVEDLIFERTWEKADGQKLGVWRAALDIGGTKEKGKEISRTEEAQGWWIDNRRRTYRRVFLCKGSSRIMSTKISVGKILETTASGKKILHFGLQVIELNTIILKNLFFHSIDQATKKASGAAYLNANTPENYFSHITAEVQELDGTYRKIANDNHWLDCEMMQQGMITQELQGGLRAVSVAKEVQEQNKVPEEKPKIQNDGWVGKTGFLGRPGGWNRR